MIKAERYGRARRAAAGSPRPGATLRRAARGAAGPAIVTVSGGAAAGRPATPARGRGLSGVLKAKFGLTQSI